MGNSLHHLEVEDFEFECSIPSGPLTDKDMNFEHNKEVISFFTTGDPPLLQLGFMDCPYMNPTKLSQFNKSIEFFLGKNLELQDKQRVHEKVQMLQLPLTVGQVNILISEHQRLVKKDRVFYYDSRTDRMFLPLEIEEMRELLCFFLHEEKYKLFDKIRVYEKIRWLKKMLS